MLAFVGLPASRRFALPHVRFRFQDPTDRSEAGIAETIEEQAWAASDRRAPVIALLADATGQTESRVEADVTEQRAFDADEAVEYGLVNGVVQSRREIE